MRTSVGGHVDDVVVLPGRTVLDRRREQAVVGAEEPWPTDVEHYLVRLQVGSPTSRQFVPPSIVWNSAARVSSFTANHPSRAVGKARVTAPARVGHPKGFGHGPGEPTVACLVGPGRRVWPPSVLEADGEAHQVVLLWPDRSP